jgi:hypothetical protein
MWPHMSDLFLSNKVVKVPFCMTRGRTKEVHFSLGDVIMPCHFGTLGFGRFYLRILCFSRTPNS